jgi:hypothetical protein
MKRIAAWFSHFQKSNYLNPIAIPLMFMILLALAIQGCGSTGGAKPANQSGTTAPSNASSGSGDELDQAMNLQQALITLLDDNRPQILEQMGPPDVFKITFQDLNGTRVRQEEWSYLDDQTRFDFINGTLVWTINLNSVPDMSLNASIYDPLSFTDGMTVNDVQTVLNGQQLTPVDLTDYGIPTGQALAGDQILLGFEAGKLVSVQTFELEPGVTQ